MAAGDSASGKGLCSQPVEIRTRVEKSAPYMKILFVLPWNKEEPLK